MKIVAAAALSVTALLGGLSAVSAQERGGVMTYGRYTDSLFLDPVLNDANVDIWVMTNFYETLIMSSPDGMTLKPGLATEWSVNEAGDEVTLKLREGVKFSDGTPMTTEDVIWSLNRAKNPDNGIWNFILASVDTVTAPDAGTIVIKLKYPDPTILAALSVFNTAIMPKAAFEAMPGETDAEKAQEFGKHPIGTGPFVLTSWDRGSSMKMTRNEYYWAKGADGKPLPYLDGLNFEVIPDDATRILKLQSGDIDGAEFIPFARVGELKADPNIKMELFPGTRVWDIIMNVRPEINGKPNPLADEKVRQAMNYAANKEALVQVVTYGVGTPLTSFMASSTPMHSGDKPLFPYDLEKAKALMAESGYPDGFKISILTIAGNQDDLGITTALQQMWKAIGIDLEIRQVDNASRTEQYRAGTFEMRTGGWTNDISDPSQITSYFAYSPTIDALHSGWKNAEVDKLFEESQKEMDPVKRAEQFARIQEIFNATGPTIPLYETPYPVALSQKVNGFYQIPLGNNIFTETWLDQ
ncbi:ABC transporter substrate-binding protein [Frigidibacter sp. ROC022]|uniref:ABC transporter substrate-binding protein n=1 Tax=Frigidibacter sp. ROC022 TaxID=2971796 RepID=UPI00215AC7EC|nr:ABC transporter substrate-binding protein [Frigidibacter sp. ROC022]MCR8725500.1 ABC transporter substrate-binding protein [Frigidibacter sp. ROC022]